MKVFISTVNQAAWRPKPAADLLEQSTPVALTIISLPTQSILLAKIKACESGV